MIETLPSSFGKVAKFSFIHVYPITSSINTTVYKTEIKKRDPIFNSCAQGAFEIEVPKGKALKIESDNYMLKQNCTFLITHR